MKISAIVVVLALLPCAASAQSNGSGVFVQVGPLANFAMATDFSTTGIASASLILGEPSASTDDETTVVTRSRTAAGGSVAAGVFIAPSVSLRVEGSFQGSHTSTTVNSSALAGIRDEMRRVTKISDVIVAASWHQHPGRRLHVNYLAGMVFRREAGENTTVFSYPSVSTSFVNGRVVQNVTTITDEDTVSYTGYGAGIMAGIDLVWKLSDSLSVVPQFRMVQATNELALRPGITLRWQP